MFKYFEQQVYHLLPHFLTVAPISNSLLVYQLFYCLEPTAYEPVKVIQSLKQPHQTYDCKSAFYYDIGRDKWRFCNNFQRANVSLGYYRLNGGEGKGIMNQSIHQIYDPYSTPNIRFKALEKEWTKSLLLNKFHITFDELPRLHHNGKVSSEGFQVIDKDAITTREMYSNDETISLYCGYDFNANAKNFSGLFKHNAIRRRIYPIKNVLVKRFKNNEEQDEWWNFAHQCIK
jgi:hypothetical protein